jgi:hypothetical protein
MILFEYVHSPMPDWFCWIVDRQLLIGDDAEGQPRRIAPKTHFGTWEQANSENLHKFVTRWIMNRFVSGSKCSNQNNDRHMLMLKSYQDKTGFRNSHGHISVIYQWKFIRFDILWSVHVRLIRNNVEIQAGDNTGYSIFRRHVVDANRVSDRTWHSVKLLKFCRFFLKNVKKYKNIWKFIIRLVTNGFKSGLQFSNWDSACGSNKTSVMGIETGLWGSKRRISLVYHPIWTNLSAFDWSRRRPSVGSRPELETPTLHTECMFSVFANTFDENFFKNRMFSFWAAASQRFSALMRHFDH